ncbi:hypothetical protein FSARC_4719 [Fusarium sarcochroum]|uniref:BTB domain-containing protein n=1 Tax=Fusarium sarcochroum TaxID=1208366 RepID=A0A8H4XB69_9HYPO|nr:hypothetical protein FSARC_4719 [Fusarium sarcochroum]
MKSIVYDIDPGGDIELVLHHPNTMKVVPTLNFVNFCPALPVDQAPEEGSGSASRNPNSENHNAGLSNVSSLSEDPSILSSLDDILVGSGDGPVEVRMRASSSHLKLASPILKSILSLNGGHAIRSARSLRELPVYNWDAKALAIVLNVIHGRNQQVPRKINLELMAHVATVVEHYQCAESLQLSAEMWYSMADKPPTELSKESVI